VFPELSERERRKIARRSYAMFGRAFLEQVSARRFTKTELLERFTVVGGEHLERAWSMNRGMMLATGHVGAFDLSAFPITQRIGPCHVLIRPPSNPYLKAEFEAVRGQLDTINVPRGRSAHRLYNLLRQKECIGIALDQRVRPWDGMLIDFLGHPAWTSPVPAYLAWKTRAPVLPLFCLPAEPGRYRLEIREPIVIEDEHYDPADILRRLNADLERQILTRPDLWFWPHDRWRLRVQHQQRFALERVRREADLDDVLGALDPRARPDPAFGALASGRFLERAQHLLVAGQPAAIRAWSRGLGEALLGHGDVVRAIEARALLARLGASSNEAKRRRGLHALDPAALLIVTGLDARRDPRELGLIAELVEHRRTRGAMAVLVETDAENHAANDIDVLRRQLPRVLDPILRNAHVVRVRS
jgi:KDO2-lipid IV(A) lauroyltransferase